MNLEPDDPTNRREAIGSLSPQSSCRRLLSWSYVLADPKLAASLPPALVRAGFQDVTRFERVKELQNRAGHAVIVVPRTGRVDIRIHYTTREASRATAARRVAETISKALAARGESRTELREGAAGAAARSEP